MIQSLARAHALLTVVRAHPEGIGVRALARAADLHAATTNNLVQTLCDLGYLFKDERSQYRLGIQAALPGYSDAGHAHLAAVAEAPIRAAIGERPRVSELSVLMGMQRQPVLIARHCEPSQVPGRIGDGYSLHDTTIGQVLLAWAPADLQDAYCRNARFTKRDQAVTSESELRGRLEAVRSAGFASSLDTPLGSHLLGVSMPLCDPQGHAIAACNLHLALNRTDSAEQAAEQKALQSDLAAAMSTMRHALGWEPTV